MRHSLRIKSTLLFVGLTALVLITCWTLNRWYFGRYYISQKKSTLIKAYEDISGLLDEGNLDRVNLRLKQFSEKYNIAMVLVDASGQSTFSSSADIAMMRDKVSRYILGYSGEVRELLHSANNYEILRTYDSRMNAYYMESWGFFSNGTVFIMSTPLASIQESVDISNRFLSYIGIIALAASGIAMFFATRTVTKPILELALLSKRMSNLNFEARYTGQEKDEIGILGNSMNELSEQLERTVTELKSANNQLKRDIEEKNKIDEMRTEFLSNVSHELKTPIALVQGYAEGLREGIIDDEESRKFYCEVIMDEANKMNKIVKQLLTLNQLEFGKDSIHLERFNLTVLIEGLILSAGILFEQKGASIEFVHQGSVYVWADEFKIEEVLTNYLSNALNHVSGAKRIIIKVETLNAVARVSVFNTGKPIPEEDIDKIWQKFYKVDKARTREYGGSGVGLSIVQAIMEAHNMKYGVRNLEDGVEFWFELDCGSGVF